MSCRLNFSKNLSKSSSVLLLIDLIFQDFTFYQFISIESVYLLDMWCTDEVWRLEESGIVLARMVIPQHSSLDVP